MTGHDTGGVERPGARRRVDEGPRSSQGADVVYAAAGGTGVGVLQAAADADITVDRASIRTRKLPAPGPGPHLDAQARPTTPSNDVFEAGPEGFEPGVHVMGLENEGVGYAPRRVQRRPLINAKRCRPPSTRRAKQIIDGEIEVVSRTTRKDSCPVLEF